MFYWAFLFVKIIQIIFLLYIFIRIIKKLCNVCVCVCVCARARVRACVCVCARAPVMYKYVYECNVCINNTRYSIILHFPYFEFFLAFFLCDKKYKDTISLVSWKLNIVDIEISTTSQSIPNYFYIHLYIWLKLNKKINFRCKFWYV